MMKLIELGKRKWLLPPDFWVVVAWELVRPLRRVYRSTRRRNLTCNDNVKLAITRDKASLILALLGGGGGK